MHHQICMRYTYNSKPVRDISWEEGLSDNLQLQKFSSLTTADHNFHPVEYFIISSSSIFVSSYSTLDEFHLVTIILYLCNPAESIVRRNAHKSRKNPPWGVNAHEVRQNQPCGETLTNPDRIYRAKQRNVHKSWQNPQCNETLTNPDRITNPGSAKKRSQLSHMQKMIMETSLAMFKLNCFAQHNYFREVFNKKDF
jgi:hypothetical protein